ncbi:MAG: hypothetical protein LBL41_02810 [Bifidobacteriaceae bacterium]|jgi:hypothetical protein|nr:hypothetical protein [Bifidobacteriaceae bacterium]
MTYAKEQVSQDSDWFAEPAVADGETDLTIGDIFHAMLQLSKKPEEERDTETPIELVELFKNAEEITENASSKITGNLRKAQKMLEKCLDEKPQWVQEKPPSASDADNSDSRTFYYSWREVLPNLRKKHREQPYLWLNVRHAEHYYGMILLCQEVGGESRQIHQLFWEIYFTKTFQKNDTAFDPDSPHTAALDLYHRANGFESFLALKGEGTILGEKYASKPALSALILTNNSGKLQKTIESFEKWVILDEIDEDVRKLGLLNGQ